MCPASLSFTLTVSLNSWTCLILNQVLCPSRSTWFTQTCNWPPSLSHDTPLDPFSWKCRGLNTTCPSCQADAWPLCHGPSLNSILIGTANFRFKNSWRLVGWARTGWNWRQEGPLQHIQPTLQSSSYGSLQSGDNFSSRWLAILVWMQQCNKAIKKDICLTASCPSPWTKILVLSLLPPKIHLLAKQG